MYLMRVNYTTHSFDEIFSSEVEFSWLKKIVFYAVFVYYVCTYICPSCNMYVCQFEVQNMGNLVNFQCVSSK